MEIIQVLANGIVLGGLYACIAVGFSLVWGVLNIINMMHGSFIILGGYIAYFAFAHLGLHPYVMMPVAGALMFVFGYILQRGIINHVITAPVLTTLTLTFGLDMIIYNKGGQDFILMSNSSRGVMKLPATNLDGYEHIGSRVADKAGVDYETLELTGVEQLDQLDDGHAVILSRAESGSLDLTSIALP